MRRRVLISANAVSPARGSEPGVGWQIASRLAEYHDVTVLCAPGVPGPDASCFKDEITAAGPVPSLTIEFVDPPPLSFLFQRESTLARRTVYYAGYKAWQKAAYRRAVQLHQTQPFDLAHQLNMTGYREPGYLWKLPTPFVWGPIGGASLFPDGYFDLLTGRDKLFYSVRNWTNRLQSRSRRCRKAAARALHLWTISREDADLVRSWGQTPEPMLETGSAPRSLAAIRSYDGNRPLRLIWSGRHLGRKALPIVLHALAGEPRTEGTPEVSGGVAEDRLLREYPPFDKLTAESCAARAVELTVLGDGPETAQWQRLAESLKLPNVTWAGNLSQADALTAVSNADLMLFPSVLEGTPHVVVESLSLGVPVICHDSCGMGTAVTDDCGVRLPVVDSQTSIAGFAAAIGRLASAPAELRRLSAGALVRAEQLSWDAKAASIAAVYEQVLSEPGRVGPVLSGPTRPGSEKEDR